MTAGYDTAPFPLIGSARSVEAPGQLPRGGSTAHCQLLPTDIAPAFTQRPVDTTVTDGMTAVLRCEVSGAPKPAITWKKGRWLCSHAGRRLCCLSFSLSLSVKTQ